MSLMRGVPATDTWLGGISFGIAQLAGMKRGEVRLDDLTLSIVGEAADLAAFRSIRSAASHPPKGIKISLDQLVAPSISPYVWTAQFAGGKFDLSGYFPDEAVHAQLVAAAKAATGDAAVTDRMQPGKGAPPDWSARHPAPVVRALSKLEDGSAELKDATLLVSGVSADEAAAETVRALLRADLPQSVKLTEQIRPREPRKASAQEPPRPPNRCRRPRLNAGQTGNAGQARSTREERNTNPARAEGGGPLHAEERRAHRADSRNKGRGASQEAARPPWWR